MPWERGKGYLAPCHQLLHLCSTEERDNQSPPIVGKACPWLRNHPKQMCRNLVTREVPVGPGPAPFSYSAPGQHPQLRSQGQRGKTHPRPCGVTPPNSLENGLGDRDVPDDGVHAPHLRRALQDAQRLWQWLSLVSGGQGCPAVRKGVRAVQHKQSHSTGPLEGHDPAKGRLQEKPPARWASCLAFLPGS